MTTFTHFFNSGLYFFIRQSPLDQWIFLIAFTLVFSFSQWKNLLTLFLAIWIGSSVSLFLGGLHIINVPSNILRLLSPASILLVATQGLIHSGNSTPSVIRYNIMVILGLIQGLIYASRFDTSLTKSSQKFMAISGLDAGLIISNLAVILLTLAICSLLLLILRSNRRDFNMVLSGIFMGMALMLLWLRF